MEKVKDKITNFFVTFASQNPTLYSDLFGNNVSAIMDKMLLNKCGERYCSYLAINNTVNDIVRVVTYQYGDKWVKIKTLLTEEYDSFKPMKITNATTGVRTNTHTNISNSTDINAVIGFDSVEETEKEKDTNNNTTNINESENNSNNVISEGNNGNMLNADIINKEIEARQNALISIVLSDIQNLIALNIY